MRFRQRGGRMDDLDGGRRRQEDSLIDGDLPDRLLEHRGYSALNEPQVLPEHLRRNNAVASGSQDQIGRSRPLLRVRIELSIDQDIAVERDTGHAASPPYLSPSVIAPTRYPVARFDRRLFSSAANAERDCGSVAGSGGCGEMRATGVPFLVIMIVSPCSAAAISCEKFWLASRPDISRLAP